jgi:hypothetical protein
MKKAKFVIETGKLNSNGDIIYLDGLKIPGKKIPILKDFETHNCIGFADVVKEDGVLKANAEFTNKYFDGFPAIGFQIISSQPNEHGGKNITEAKLYSVGISMMPNSDPSIKRLSEQ